MVFGLLLPSEMSLLFLFPILFFPSIASSQSDLIFTLCSDNLYTSGSPYESALQRLLANLTASAPKSTLLYSSLSDFLIFGFAQCRSDASSIACANCLRLSSSKLTNAANGGCGRSLSAAAYQDMCLLRYSNTNFSASLDENIVGYLPSLLKSSNQSDFSRRVAELMGKISWDASTTLTRLAAGVAEAGDAQVQNIYGLVWCTRDLVSNDCFQCLMSAVGKLPLAMVGGRVFEMSCILRFEEYIFFDSSLIKSQNSPELLPAGFRSDNITADAGENGESSNSKALLIVAISEGIALMLSYLAFLVLLLRKRDKLSIAPIKHDTNTEEMGKDKSLLLDFSVISSATGNFSEEYKLGEGGFGPVYKGVLIDGEEIAVKRLSKTSGQGVIELKNEVAFVAKLQHRNLVRLLGCCLEKEEKLLVYEFLPNTSLDKHLFDSDHKIQLDWGTRYKIIEGIAQGLVYLHEDSRVRIIHCDMKASNILLDGNMNPKISDFGMAKLFGMDEAQLNTSRIAGTYGYMAPEYALRGFYSTKSDVFSYGVLILEIVTGRKNIYHDESVEFADLLSFVWRKWKQGEALQAVDQSLGDRYMPKQALRCLQIGLLCIQEDPAQRPSMASLVVMLSSYSLVLPEPLMPTFLK